MESNIYNMAFALDNEHLSDNENRSWMSNPEIRLLWAIIERAVRDSRGNDVVEREAAVEWFTQSSVENPEEFSFQWICETLDIVGCQLLKKIFPETEEIEYKIAC